MTAPRPSAGWQRLSAAMLHVMGAGSIEGVLAAAVQWMAGLSGADTAAAFTVDGDRILEEGWSPGPPPRGQPIGDLLRVLALESARTGAPFECTPTDRSAETIRIIPLQSDDRAIGAVALVQRGPHETSPELEERLELMARFAVIAVLSHRRIAELRAASDQQKRWFDQLDQQVRVLDRERQKFAAVVNQSDTYAFVVDPGCTIRWVNRTMSQRRPPPGPAAWTGRGCRDVCTTLASAAGACQTCPVTQALGTNGPIHDELHATVDDRRLTFYATALPIRGVDGRPQEVLVIMQDLSDLEALRESEERYHVVAQAASDGIVTIDEAGTILFVNDALLEMFGYAQSELVGGPLTRLMPPALAERHRRALQAYVSGGNRTMSWRGIQLPAVHRDGHEILLEMSFGEFVKGGRRLFTGVLRDVTARRRAQEELERAQDQLRQSRNMEAIGRLAGGIAHDFNNLLTTVLGHSTMLLHEDHPSSETERRLAEIKRAAERAAALTRQLLEFSRHRLVEPRVYDLNRIVTDMEDLLRQLIGEEIELELVPAPELAPVRADPHQLDQVVMNLAVHARDAMPRGGRLRLEIRVSDQPVPSAGGPLAVGQGAPAGAGSVTFEVRSWGRGVDPAAGPRVPGFAGEEHGQVAGLGLAIVHGIVQQVGGAIDGDGEPGTGAALTLHFPRSEELLFVETTTGEPVARAGTETLLLVEDEPPVRSLTREMLVGLGYKVLDAANGAEGLAIAGRHDGAIDLVVTDVVMPGMSGGEMVERLLASRPTLRVLYMSGYPADEIVHHGVSHADSSFLQKPFTYETFAARVRETLDRPPARHANADDQRRAA